MEQVIYFLEHCTSESEALIGLINYVVILFVLPVLVLVMLPIGFTWLFWKLLKSIDGKNMR